MTGVAIGEGVGMGKEGGRKEGKGDELKKGENGVCTHNKSHKHY